jgi:hypothetical protein
MSYEISVKAIGGPKYRVTVHDGGSKTVHEVHVSPRDLDRYGGGAPAEQLLKASFEFLLGRESKESILRSFDLAEIERYFPDYPRQLRDRM